MNTEKEYVLEMKDITKHYGENTVLNGVSLSVKKGEIHALLGEQRMLLWNNWCKWSW